MPPRLEIVDDAVGIAAPSLAVIGTLTRTYNPQRLRLLQRAGDRPGSECTSSLRPLNVLDHGIRLDGSSVSGSIVDTVTKTQDPAGQTVALPFLTGPPELLTAEAGWWAALLGDVERRTGLSPRSVRVSLPSGIPEQVRVIFAEREPR